MKLNPTGPAQDCSVLCKGRQGSGCFVRFFLSFSLLGICDSLTASDASIDCRSGRLGICSVYRVYIRQLLCMSADYSPMPLSGYPRNRR